MYPSTGFTLLFRTAALALLALLLVAPPAAAKLCGDDVNGQDVPCECGDTVVSDIRLTNDPVTTTTCPADGLIIRAPGATAALVIDLAGRTLRGSGRGVGIWVFEGGPDGAQIVSPGTPGTIEGFRDGIVGQGARSVSLIDGVVARANGRDGIRLFGIGGAEIRNSEAHESGRDGFFVTGKTYLLTGTRAVNSGRHGYNMMGTGGTLGTAGAGNTAEDSGAAGFAVMGAGHRLIDCVATGSGRDGVKMSGMHQEITGCIASNNGGDGIAGRGMAWQVAGNQALGNTHNGIVISGSDLVDGGGNTGSGNQGLLQNRPVVQCAIASNPCLP